MMLISDFDLNRTANVKCPTLTGVALYAQPSFTGNGKIEILLGRMPSVLMCLDSVLLIQVKLVSTKGKQASEVGFSLGGSTFRVRLRAQ